MCVLSKQKVRLLTVRFDITEKLNILLVGAGGREHAIAWKLAQSDRVQHIFVAPGKVQSLQQRVQLLTTFDSGNGGTSNGNKITNVNIGVSDFAQLTQFALENKVIISRRTSLSYLLGLLIDLA